MNQSIKSTWLRNLSLCAIACAATASADQLNVSNIVTGTPYNINWNTVANYSVVPAQAAFKYYALGNVTARRTNTTLDSVGTGPYGNGWQGAITNPNLSAGIPANPYTKNGLSYKYSSPNFSLASVNGTGSPKLASAMAFESANAESVVSYAFKIEHTGATQDYFMNLAHPTFQRMINAGYKLTSGPNGGTYSYYKPTDANARMSIDIYADGLPVWTSESNYNYPGKLATYAWDKIETFFGINPQGTISTLYLGKLSAGQNVTLTFVVRSSARTKVDSCPIDNDWDGTYILRCHQHTDTVKINNLPIFQMPFSVYTRVLP